MNRVVGVKRYAMRGRGSAGLDEAIVNREVFNTNGAMRGDSGTYQSLGELPTDWRNAIYNDNPSYVVYSYATPIAWKCERGWVIPPVTYSATTSRHQSFVRRALKVYHETLPGE